MTSSMGIEQNYLVVADNIHVRNILTTAAFLAGDGLFDVTPTDSIESAKALLDTESLANPILIFFTGIYSPTLEDLHSQINHGTKIIPVPEGFEVKNLVQQIKATNNDESQIDFPQAQSAPSLPNPLTPTMHQEFRRATAQLPIVSAIDTHPDKNGVVSRIKHKLSYWMNPSQPKTAQ